MSYTRKYSTSEIFVASKAFKFDGEIYNIGDKFPWHELGCSEAKLNNMVSIRMLSVDDNADKKVSKPKPKPKAKAKPKAKTKAKRGRPRKKV